ncbi:MAG: MotA/TolQ/ExbB proton channel family protein [Lautropia sp.]|nr:MotA/TolQ/ExbB proton channel family protein [Lautropia sp.]
MNETPTLGFSHFLSQGDAVSKALLVILLGMSVVSWTLILIKGLTILIRGTRADRFLKSFWESTSMQDVAQDIASHGVRDPFSRVAANALQAMQHYARTGSTGRMADSGSPADFLTRTIKKVLDEETVRMENGLSVLATVGATAPFFGLFGTVWGVYHALVNIGMSGSGSLDKVAGPVGEALIMTGLGLAVALPAVIGYNWLARRNRVLSARLDAFAFELFNFLSSGATLSNHHHNGSHHQKA